MTYELCAVIAAAESVSGWSDMELGLPWIALGQGLAMIPNQADPVCEVGGPEGDLLERIVSWSRTGPVAYVEAKYFGGMGAQYAAVWHSGHMILGPLTCSEDDPAAVEGSRTSQALRELGAQPDGWFDEFEAVGLGRHRSIEDWLAAAYQEGCQ